MGFSRQEYRSWLPFPSPGDLPDPGIEPGSPEWQADALPFEPPGKLSWLLATPTFNWFSKMSSILTALWTVLPSCSALSSLPLPTENSTSQHNLLRETFSDTKVGTEDSLICTLIALSFWKVKTRASFLCSLFPFQAQGLVPGQHYMIICWTIDCDKVSKHICMVALARI